MCPLPFFSCYLFKLYLLSFPLKFLFDHRVILFPSVFFSSSIIASLHTLILLVSVSSQIFLRILIRMLSILFVPESFLSTLGLGLWCCVSVCLLGAAGFFSWGGVGWCASIWQCGDDFPGEPWQQACSGLGTTLLPSPGLLLPCGGA